MILKKVEGAIYIKSDDLVKVGIDKALFQIISYFLLANRALENNRLKT